MQLVFHKGKQLLLSGGSELQPQSFISGQSVGFSDVQSTGRIEMITAVSYTHLDVYKRQVLLGYSYFNKVIAVFI